MMLRINVSLRKHPGVTNPDLEDHGPQISKYLEFPLIIYTPLC